MCKTPELAAEVTIQPVDVLGVDAAILFSDILTTVEPMGMHLSCPERMGPFFENPIRNQSDVDKLIMPEPDESLSFVLKTIQIVVSELQNKVPLIGFAGAPFTVAAYMVEGSEAQRSPLFFNTRKMIAENPDLFLSLVEKVGRFTTAYLKAQIRAGAPVVMHFDSRAEILCPDDYARFAFPAVEESILALKSEGVPIIYYVKGCAGLLNIIKHSSADVMGLDEGIRLDNAIKQLGSEVVVQGNLDPFALFMPRDGIKKCAQKVVSMASGAKGHIFSLGSGIHHKTPVDNTLTLIETVHELSKT
jgi:uroporphyrinogen decarboxylase